MRKNLTMRKVRGILTSKMANMVVMTMLFTIFGCMSVCFAAGGDAITTAQSLLSKAATAGGGLWAVWGLVQLGMSLKDHNGPGIGAAIWQILGGAVIIAAGTAVSALDLTMATA